MRVGVVDVDHVRNQNVVANPDAGLRPNLGASTDIAVPANPHAALVPESQQLSADMGAFANFDAADAGAEHYEFRARVDANVFAQGHPGRNDEGISAWR